MPRLQRGEHESPQGAKGSLLIVLGVLLLVFGWALGIGLLETLGMILLIIGLVLLVFGATGHPVGNRPWWY
jgi:hypothetical protein